jgi:hypothetical protein
VLKKKLQHHADKESNMWDDNTSHIHFFWKKQEGIPTDLFIKIKRSVTKEKKKQNTSHIHTPSNIYFLMLGQEY